VRANRFGIGTLSIGEDKSNAGLCSAIVSPGWTRIWGAGVSVRSILEEWRMSLASLENLADRLTSDDCEHRLAEFRQLRPV
jgi:hypothetical protein